ncbi:MAG: YbaK/EbsC family protein [Chloroflexi bacterium]|nr:MAG: YbaK/EbsC family protein [Chloroflexota bacterium]
MLLSFFLNVGHYSRWGLISTKGGTAVTTCFMLYLHAMSENKIVLTSADLAEFVARNQIAAKIVHLPVQTPTVAAAADALGVSPAQIIKSVLFLADGEPVLVVARGPNRIAWKRLADYLGVSRRRLKTADAAQVLAITGYPVGAVPPFGHRQRLRTVVETAVYDQAVVYGGGGEMNALMQLRTTELRRVVGGETAELAEPSSTP